MTCQPGSLEISSFLIQTYSNSGDERFLNATQLFIDSDHYDINIINQKVMTVCQVKFSTDELAYLSYFIYQSKEACITNNESIIGVDDDRIRAIP